VANPRVSSRVVDVVDGTLNFLASYRRVSSRTTTTTTTTKIMADGGVLAISLPPDVDRVALGAILPDVVPEALTPDGAITLFRSLLSLAIELGERQREVEEAHAELERKDVELDQAYQDKETATKDLEATVDVLQRELNAVKHERDSLRKWSSLHITLDGVSFPVSSRVPNFASGPAYGRDRHARDLQYRPSVSQEQDRGRRT
jgi:hypothetical protein